MGKPYLRYIVTGNLHGGVLGGALTDDELAQRGRLQAPPENALYRLSRLGF